MSREEWSHWLIERGEDEGFSRTRVAEPGVVVVGWAITVNEPGARRAIHAVARAAIEGMTGLRIRSYAGLAPVSAIGRPTTGRCRTPDSVCPARTANQVDQQLGTATAIISEPMPRRPHSPRRR